MRLPTISRRRGFHAISPDEPQETQSKIHELRAAASMAEDTHWTVHNNPSSVSVNSFAQAAGPAEDLSTQQVAELVAEVRRLEIELSSMQQVVDNLLDRESMHALTPHMECLTTAAAIDRLGVPRAQRLPVLAVETTVAAALGSAVRS
ncbi:hypothetical protein [Nocardia tengchongensis]|uniref:hypothetical protein n=1 Tax=Nocardia tengchongensis TaxID=2055889 RepID=UPI00361B49DB